MGKASTIVRCASHAELILASGLDESRAHNCGDFLRMPVTGQRATNIKGWLTVDDKGVEKAGIWGQEDTLYIFDPHAKDRRRLSRAEIEEEKKKAAWARLRRQYEQADKNQDAAKTAKRLYAAADDTAVNSHAYLVKKQVAGRGIDSLRVITPAKYREITGKYPFAEGEIIKSGRLLLVPALIDNEIRTVQVITENGLKSFLAGGSTKGCYWPIRPLPPDNAEGIRFLIGEGVATMLSIYQDAGFYKEPDTFPLAALNCGNLTPVCKRIRERYPSARMDLIADLDANAAGQIHADQANIYAQGCIFAPDFLGLYARYGIEERPAKRPTDWNDYFILLRKFSRLKKPEGGAGF